MSQAQRPKLRTLKPVGKPAKITGGHLQAKSDDKPASPMEKTQDITLVAAQQSTSIEKPVAQQPAAAPVKGTKAAAKKQPATARKPRAAQPTQPAPEPVVVAAQQPTQEPVVIAAQQPTTEAKRRAHNLRPTTQDISGIGIAPPRVKSVLVSKCLNPREVFAKQAIQRAERPAKVGDEQPAPVPVAHLGEEILSVIREAEQDHEQQLRTAYENQRLKTLQETDKAAYLAYMTSFDSCKAAQGDQFNVKQFNVQYDQKFYDQFAAYKQEKDPYAVGARVSQTLQHGDQPKVYNQWTRAYALINKACIRLSVNTRNILAIFLDKIVEEYAENGMRQCVAQQCSSMHLRHALERGPNFEQCVTHDRFVGTFDCYKKSVQWMADTVAQRAAYQETRRANPTAVFNPPVYPTVPSANEFLGYVSEVCRSVKLRLARHAENETTKSAYLSISLNKEFRLFCANVVFEAIMRVGECLKQSVKWNGTKTINESLLFHTLQLLHTCCGANYQSTAEHIQKRLAHHKEWRAANKKNKTTADNTSTADRQDIIAQEQDADDSTVAVDTVKTEY